MTNFESYKSKFTSKALRVGYSAENIVKCLEYSQILIEQNLPIIFNSYHLAALVGYQHSYLSRSIISTEFFYRHFKVKKRNGSYRKISEPLPSLKEIQLFILKEILYSQKASRYCKSYIPKKNIIDYLKFHANEKVILTIDISNFFPSIKFKLVEDYFLKLGYATDVSDYLACLCTYTTKANSHNKYKRYLPQGAPTSPYLSNLILKDFDENLALYCKKNEIKYTRYADDMAFSGDDLNKAKILKFVTRTLKPFNLELNKEKTNLMKKNVPQIVSGVVLNKKMQIPKNERNKIRNIMYFIMKYSLDDHLERINEKRDNYVPHLLGRIQYALNLNKEDAELKKYKDFLLKLKK